MDTTFLAGLDFVPATPPVWRAEAATPVVVNARHGVNAFALHRDQELLRRLAWEIGENKALDKWQPDHNHVGVAMVNPYHGYAQWRMRHEWVEDAARQRGDAWHHCRMVVRLYDISYIQFNGFNAHHIQDIVINHLTGHLFFHLARPGTTQLAELGFVLRTGEFIPAARSAAARFARDSACPHTDHAALYVDGRGTVEHVGNLWDQEGILQEKRRPRLRTSLRIAAFSFQSLATGHQSGLARFVSELAAGQAARGHQVTLFQPVSDQLREPREVDGVRYEPLPVCWSDDPIELAQSFAASATTRLHELPPFDLHHCHEWQTALTPRIGTGASVVSLSSLEASRRNGTPPSELSQKVEQIERQVARNAGVLLTPDWLRDQAINHLELDGQRVHPFSMEPRLPTDWNRPLDVGQVKKEIGFGPLDRLMVFVGPLEHGAGVDILLEAMPTLLHRAGNIRVAFAGSGSMFQHLEQRMHQLGVAWAVRLLGHVEGHYLTRVLRAAESLILPSRYRMPFDDAVVDLARRAGKPVITTHAGPAHLVKHEETGLVTYDNPGSMVWALDRILTDPGHAEQMGRQGRLPGEQTISWQEVTQHYLDLCAACFPELRQV